MPVGNFIASGSVASSATLKQGEADLVAHVHTLWRLFGRSWVKVLLLAAMLDNLFGNGSHPENPNLEPVWQPAETVDSEGRNQEAEAQQKTGVPNEYIWRYVWGYDEDQVTAMKRLRAAAVTTPADAPQDDADSPDSADSTPTT
jgi:hypothetical protein